MSVKRKNKILAGTLAVILILISAFYIWASQYYKAMPQAVSSISSDGKVNVENGRYITFTPVNNYKRVGVIIYPGGKVSPQAYAPVARHIAENGYKVVIVPMPLNLAVLAPSKAMGVVDSFSDVDAWVMAGHSLGGTMACKFAYDNPDLIKGIILFASYPSKSNDLSEKNIKVLSVYGTVDAFVDSKKISETKELLPGDTVYKPIEGGNHSQMGYYGFQKGDKEAKISREQQQNEVLESVLEFLKNIKK